MDGTERLPGPGVGTGWDSGENGQHRSHRGFCPTCDAACCSGETPGLEAAARKAGIAWLSLAGEQQHRGGCKSLHAAWLPNHGPLPKRRSLPAGAAGGRSALPARSGRSREPTATRDGARRAEGWGDEAGPAGAPCCMGNKVHGHAGAWCQQPPSLAAGFRTAQQPVSHAPSLAT